MPLRSAANTGIQLKPTAPPPILSVVRSALIEFLPTSADEGAFRRYVKARLSSSKHTCKHDCWFARYRMPGRVSCVDRLRIEKPGETRIPCPDVRVGRLWA